MVRLRIAVLAIASCAFFASLASADEVQFDERGFSFETENLEIGLGGRLHVDTAQIDDGGVEDSDSEVRRARLEISLRFFDDWRLRLDREFTDGGEWRNVWLSYNVSERFRVRAGNFTAPFSAEDIVSSNDTMFMERSLANALAPGFGLGVGANYRADNFTLSGGYFDDALDSEDNAQAEKGRGVSARATWTPIERDNVRLHLAVAGDRRDLDAGEERRISADPEASLGPTVVSTGGLAGLDGSTSYNVEAGMSLGPVLVQGQYITTDLQRVAGEDIGLDGYYVQAGWVVTGERHRYSDISGVFSSPRPRGKWGALEIAARVSSLDLSEADGRLSGVVDDTTIGANWYIGRNVRLSTNFVHSEVDAVDPLLSRDLDVVQARAQVAF